MKKMLVTLLVCCSMGAVMGQKYFTKNAQVNFDATSASSPEKIEGINRSGTCVIDLKSGNMQMAVLMKGFGFERALMEEHFNENYVESHKYPKAEFKGDLKDADKIDVTQNGTHTVKVKGKLTLHGESREIETDAKFIIQEGKIKASTDFSVLLADYKITIPGLVADKVSKTAKIGVYCTLEPFKSSN